MISQRRAPFMYVIACKRSGINAISGCASAHLHITPSHRSGSNYTLSQSQDVANITKEGIEAYKVFQNLLNAIPDL